jgi:hypothetical protein
MRAPAWSYRYLTEAGWDKMESLDAIRRFAGPEVEKTHGLPRDPEFLLELEPTVKHFDVLLGERHP